MYGYYYKYFNCENIWKAKCMAESSQFLHTQSKICSFQTQAIIPTNIVYQRENKQQVGIIVLD